MTIRIGIGIKIGEAAVISPPSAPTLTLISGGVKIDWAAGVPTDDVEIWAHSDNAASALLAIIAAGTVTHNDAGVAPVDLRYYKLRAKRGAQYSAFTGDVSIAMLGAELATGWNTAAFWSDHSDIHLSIVDGKIVSDGNNGSWQKYGFLTAGKTYKKVASITPAVDNVGGVWPIWDGVQAADVAYSWSPVPYVITYVCGAVNPLVASSYYKGTLDAVSIKEVLAP